MSISLIFLLLPLLLGSVAAYLFFKPRRTGESKTRTFFFKLNIHTHFKLLIAFMGLLILLTIAAEFITPKNPVVAPLPPKAAPNFEEDMYLIEEQIMNRQKVNDAMLVEKRTHPAGDALVIQHAEDVFDSVQIYIERKNNDDQTIEEFIYKPALLVDDYNFSDIIQVTLPVWADNIVSFQKNKTVINFVNFREAPALAQFTTGSVQQTMLDWFSSTARMPIVHLIVPEDLEIITNDETYLIFIDDYEYE